MIVTQTALDKIDVILNGIQSQPEDRVFRVELQGGGCTGFKYIFDVTNRQDDDVDIGEGAVTDSFSMMYLQDSTLDYQYTLFSQSFVIDNPKVKSTCGCGESIGF